MQYFSVSLASAVYRCKCAVQWLLSACTSQGHINPFLLDTALVTLLL